MDGELCPDQLKMTHEASILKTQNPFKQHTYKKHVLKATHFVSCLQLKAVFDKVRNSTSWLIRLQKTVQNWLSSEWAGRPPNNRPASKPPICPWTQPPLLPIGFLPLYNYPEVSAIGCLQPKPLPVSSHILSFSKGEGWIYTSSKPSSSSHGMCYSIDVKDVGGHDAYFLCQWIYNI